MSEQNSTTPPGWHPDPQDARRQRWWDGTRWTEHVHAPVEHSAPAAQPAAAQGVDTNTPWIWLVIALPLLASLFPLFYDWRGYIEASIETPTAALMSPGYLLIMLLSWLVYGLSVSFAFLDMRTLTRRGVTRPFHWAWAFLSSAAYAIGRSVVAGRRTGRTQPTLWAAIGAVVLAVVIGIIVTVIVMTAAFDVIGSSIPSS